MQQQADSTLSTTALDTITSSSTLIQIASTLRPSSIQSINITSAITTASDLLSASNSVTSPKPLTNTQVFVLYMHFKYYYSMNCDNNNKSEVNFWSK